MVIDAATREIFISLDELISFSFPSGSLARSSDFYLKPKTAAAICESFSGQNESYMLFHPFSYSYEVEGYEYNVGLSADLCSLSDNSLKIISVRASGGKKNASDSLIDSWKRETACICAICADACGVRRAEGTLLYSYDTRMSPCEIVCTESYESAKDTLAETLKKAHELISIHIERETKRKPASHDVPFPFPKKRSGQSEFMTNALKTYRSGGVTFAEAPTGIGKTMSALFPAVKAFGHGFIDRIFYLTPKTTAQYAAENAVKRIFKNGDGIRSVILSAKDKMCFFPQDTKDAQDQSQKTDAMPHREQSKCERCHASDGYYDRRNGALVELLSKSDNLDSDMIFEVAKKHEVCPYELSLDASEYCDAIICDYNYVYDCRVYLRRYFDILKDTTASERKHLPKYAVLVDEAHNLADRARNMYSHTLKTSTLNQALGTLGISAYEKKMRTHLEDMICRIDKLRGACLEEQSYTEKGEVYGFCVKDRVDERLVEGAEQFTAEYEAYKKTENASVSKELTDVYFDLKDLVKKSEYFSEAFKVLCEVYGAVTVYRIMCLDPSEILKEKHTYAKASVLFSATLSPEEYYASVLGGGKNSVYMNIESPYDKENFSISVFDTVSTRYSDRKETLYNLCEIIHTAVNTKKGNYMVFFPSYKYMEETHALYTVMHHDVATIIQRKNMDQSQRAEFVARFDENNKETLVGFCVLGGVYAEGIDLVGERLIGSIIVGVGMPRLSNERNILAEYYQNRDLDGNMFSYVYPGMTRVMQAVGRVIRSENDKGIAVLIDDRFASPVYKSLFPSHWRHAKFISSPKTMKKLLTSFWEER